MDTYIRKKDLIDLFEEVGSNATFNEANYLKMIMNRVNELIDLEMTPLVRSSWKEEIHLGYDGAVNGILYFCPVCGYETGDIDDFMYCPSCGSFMRGDEDEN